MSRDNVSGNAFSPSTDGSLNWLLKCSVTRALSSAALHIEVFHTRDPNHVTAGGDSILGVNLCNSCSGSGIDMLLKRSANLVKAS